MNSPITASILLMIALPANTHVQQTSRDDSAFILQRSPSHVDGEILHHNSRRTFEFWRAHKRMDTVRRGSVGDQTVMLGGCAITCVSVKGMQGGVVLRDKIT